MNNFNIIHHRGEAKQAQTAQNITIERQEQLFVPEWGALVTCAPYDSQFIFENPDRDEGSSAYLCTCGSVAVVVPPGPAGMFVCLFHATYGAHQTSFINKKDWHKHIGERLEIKPEKARWI